MLNVVREGLRLDNECRNMVTPEVLRRGGGQSSRAMRYLALLSDP